MNSFPAKVVKIESVDALNLVHFKLSTQELFMISLELNAMIKEETEVMLTAKSSHIALAKERNPEISISNQLETTVISITRGQLLCSVKLDLSGHMIESVITKDSAERMNLEEGEKVIALIKSSELSIMEVTG